MSGKSAWQSREGGAAMLTILSWLFDVLSNGTGNNG
jgi:hypothetical protein